MDQMRAILQKQVADVVNHPDIPDDAKVQFQNFAGALYVNQGVLSVTMANNMANTLSPFANMDSVVKVDFRGIKNGEEDLLMITRPLRRMVDKVLMTDLELTRMLDLDFSPWTRRMVDGKLMTTPEIRRMMENTKMDYATINSYMLTCESRGELDRLDQ